MYHGSSILIHFHNFHKYFPLYIFPVELWDYFVKFQNTGNFIDIALLLLLLRRIIVSNCLWPHGLQHTRHPCPSPLPEFPQTQVHWVGDTIQSPHPLLSIPFSSCLQAFPASGSFLIHHFFHIRWPKFWNFSFSISLSNECSGLISFRIDWFYPLAVQGTWDFSSTTVRRHQFFITQPFSLSSSHIHTWLLEKT